MLTKTFLLMFMLLHFDLMPIMYLPIFYGQAGYTHKSNYDVVHHCMASLMLWILLNV